MNILESNLLLNNAEHEFFKTTTLENLDSAKDIIEDIKNNGDSAIIKYSKMFNDGDFKNAQDFIISKDEIEKAYKETSKETLETLKYCIKNVEEFSKKQFECIKELEYKIQNSILGHRIIPLNRVLCYVPGGNYPLPSSAIMTCTPAKVAGVKEIMLTSPRIKPQTIVAAHLSGANKIYKLGGVQAISAFAYGTQTIKDVDKIVGPGNKYVTYAKKYVYGKCSIDFLAGPSEVLIVADDKQNPNLVSADMLAQCEHDKDARAYLICFSENFAKKVIECAKKQLEKLTTKEIAQTAFEKSYIIIAKNIKEAIEI